MGKSDRWTPGRRPRGAGEARRRLPAVLLLVVAVLLTGAAPQPGGSGPPPPAPERRLERLSPNPYEVLARTQKRFRDTGRRHIVVRPQSLTVYRSSVVLWQAPFDGTDTTLAAVSAALGGSEWASWLERGDGGVFTLRAALTQAPGTSLRVAAPEVQAVRLSTETESYISGVDATAVFSGVGVSSWNPATGAPEHDPSTGRPFVSYTRSTLVAEDSDFGYLGSDRSRAYGVNWDEGSTGSATGSTFHHNFFGVYTFKAHDIVFRRNVFRDNVVYGLDPHTHSTGLVAEDNEAFGNGSHGIIFSDAVTGGVIRGNRSHHNGKNGIVIDRDSDDTLVEGNVVTDNGLDGLVVIGSSRVTMRDNTVSGHRVGVRVNQLSIGTKVQHNRVSACRKGIDVYGGAQDTRLHGNHVTGCEQAGITVEASGSTSTDDVVRDTPLGVDVLGTAALTETRVTGAERGLVVRPGGILTARRVAVQADEHAVAVEPDGVARVSDSRLEAPRPVKGHLHRDDGNVGTKRTGPDRTLTATESVSLLSIAGAVFVLLALLLQALHDLRNRESRRTSRGRHRRRRLAGGVVTAAVAALMAVAPALVLLAESGRLRPSVEVVSRPGSGLVVTGDAGDLPALDSALERAGLPDALTRDAAGAWLLHRTVTVGPGSTLRVEDGELRLASGRRDPVALMVAGGRLVVRAATVTSWDVETRSPDTDLADGRAWVAAWGGGTMEVRGARMVALGYDVPGRHGVSWSGAGTRGVAQDSRFVGNFTGADAWPGAALRVQDSLFERSVRHGMRLTGPCTDVHVNGAELRGNGAAGLLLSGCPATVRGSTLHTNAEHGVVVAGGSSGALLERNEVFSNAGAGVELGDSSRAVVAQNLIHENAVGISVLQAARDARIEENRVQGNGAAGVHVAAGTVGTQLSRNQVSFNQGPGLRLDEGTAGVVTRNTVTDHAVGAVLGAGARARLVGNTFARSAQQAVLLDEPLAATVTGNTLVDNRTDVVAPTPGQSDDVLAANHVVDGESTVGRVRDRQ